MDSNLAETFALDGRVAVVTGAASGIGREIAVVLAEAGAAVVAADIQEGELASLAAQIAGAGSRVLAQPTNVGRKTDIDGLADRAVQSFGRIDIWVNCAGIMVKTPLLDADEETLERGISINLKGVYWGCVAAGRAMRGTGGGSIVNISSGGGEAAVPEMSIYNLTKAAVNMITRSAAMELGPFGIRANAIAPGWIDTPMVTHGFRDEEGAIDPVKRAEIVKLRRQISPIGLTGVPRDIALAALYLASDASRFVTGQILRPNGGVAML